MNTNILKPVILIVFLILSSYHVSAQIAFHDALALDEKFEKVKYIEFLQVLAKYVKESPVSLDALLTSFDSKYSSINRCLITINNIKDGYENRRRELEIWEEGLSEEIKKVDAKKKEIDGSTMELIEKHFNEKNRAKLQILIACFDATEGKKWEDIRDMDCIKKIKLDSENFRDTFLKLILKDITNFAIIDTLKSKLLESNSLSIKIDSLTLIKTGVVREKSDLIIEIEKLTTINATKPIEEVRSTLTNLKEIRPEKSSTTKTLILEDPAGNQKSILTSLDPTTELIDAFAKFLEKRVKKELTIAFFDKFKEKLDQIIELKALLPNTYTLLDGRDIFTLPTLGQSWTSAFESDMKNLLKNFELMVNEYPKYADLRKEEAYQMAIMSARSFEMLTQNVHPVKILEFLDSQYGFNEKQDRKKEYHKIISLVQLISKNMRQISTNDKKDVWIELSDLEKLDTERKRGFFLELIMHQNTVLFDTITINNEKLSDLIIKNQEKFNYSLQQMIISIKKIEIQLEYITSILKTDNKEGKPAKKEILAEIILYFQLSQEVIETGFKVKYFMNPFKIHEDEDYKKFTKISKIVSSILESIQSRNYGMALTTFLQIFQVDEILEIIDHRIELKGLLKKDENYNYNELKEFLRFDLYRLLNGEELSEDEFKGIFQKTMLEGINFEKNKKYSKKYLIETLGKETILYKFLTGEKVQATKDSFSTSKFYNALFTSARFDINELRIRLENLNIVLQNFKKTELYKQLEKSEDSTIVQKGIEIYQAISRELSKYDQNFNTILQKVAYYGGFITDILQADSSAKMLNIIERYAAPVGSYKMKRLSRFSADINAYPGIRFGVEAIPDSKYSNQLSPSYGITAPIGFSMSWTCRKDIESREKQRGAFGFFIPIVDIGAALSYRIEKSNTKVDTIDAGLPQNIDFRQILAPGLFFAWHIAKTPISLLFGAQYMPLLRQIKSTGNKINGTESIFFGAMATVDIPLFNLFGKTEKKFKEDNEKNIRIFK